MSRAGMDRSRDMNFANLVRKGVRARDCESWVMMGMPARMMCVVVIDVLIGNRCIRVWMLHWCAGGRGRCSTGHAFRGLLGTTVCHTIFLRDSHLLIDSHPSQ